MKTILHRKQTDGTFIDEIVDINCNFGKQVKLRKVVADQQGNWRSSGIDKVSMVYVVVSCEYPKNPYGPSISEPNWKARCEEMYSNLISVKTRKFVSEQSFKNVKNISSIATLTSGIHEVED